MRKARTVEIPDAPMKKGQYEKLLKHGVNSTVWYAQNYPCGEKKLRERLQKKGYREGVVEVIQDDGEVIQRYLIDNIIDQVRDKSSMLLDEESIAESMIDSIIRSGKNAQAAWTRCSKRGISREVFDKVVAERFTQDDVDEAMERAAEKIFRSSTYRKKEQNFDKRSYFMKSMMTKGFSLDDAMELFYQHEGQS